MRNIITKMIKVFLTVSLAGALVSLYFVCYYAMPSQVRLLTGGTQRMYFKLPASASIETASGTLETNLYRPVTMITGGEETTYQMDVKLLGVIPLKSVEIQVVNQEEICAAGIPVGIFLKTKGVMVVGTGSFGNREGKRCEPSAGLLQEGDYLIYYNGEEIAGKRDFMKRVGESNGETVTIGLERDNTFQEVSVTPQMNENGEYKLGIWIRDNAQGVGTLTFVDSQGNFGALGHGITDADTGELMELGRGSLYDTTIVGIQKGSGGVPGELTGMIAYDDSNVIGQITENTTHGVFGKLDMEKLKQEGVELNSYEICLKQNIHLGEASLLSSVDGTITEYAVEISAIHMGEDGGSKGLEIRVTDERLLELTGGIVQGMSGSPIVQDGKVVGAVTHVLVNDPERGYGIFIEEMLGN